MLHPLALLLIPVGKRIVGLDSTTEVPVELLGLTHRLVVESILLHAGNDLQVAVATCVLQKLVGHRVPISLSVLDGGNHGARHYRQDVTLLRVVSAGHHRWTLCPYQHSIGGVDYPVVGLAYRRAAWERYACCHGLVSNEGWCHARGHLRWKGGFVRAAWSSRPVQGLAGCHDVDSGNSNVEYDDVGMFRMDWMGRRSTFKGATISRKQGQGKKRKNSKSSSRNILS